MRVHEQQHVQMRISTNFQLLRQVWTKGAEGTQKVRGESLSSPFLHHLVQFILLVVVRVSKRNCERVQRSGVVYVGRAV